MPSLNRRYDPTKYPYVSPELWEDSQGDRFWLTRATQAANVWVDGMPATLVPGTLYQPHDSSRDDFFTWNETYYKGIGAHQFSMTHVRPEDEGARGDGVTDDLAAFITVTGFANAHITLEPGKTYRISNSLSLSSNTVIDGNGATIKLLASATGRAFLIQNKSNVTIRNLTIDMDKTETANGGTVNNQQGIYINGNVSHITLDNVTVINSWWRGIAAVGSTGQVLSDITIQHCTVNNVGENGITISSQGNADLVSPSASRGFVIRDCTVTGTMSNGIQCWGVSDVTVKDNFLDGQNVATGHGIVFSTSGTTNYVTDFTCTGNKIRNFVATSPQAKWAIAVSVNCKRFSVADNVINHCAGGITVDVEDSAAPNQQVNVIGTVKGNSSCGATVNHGINTNCATHLTISGNTCQGNALDGIALSNSAYCTIGDNTCNDNGQYGIAIFGTNAGTGGHRVGVNIGHNCPSGVYNTPTCPIPVNYATVSTTVPTV